MQFIFSKAASNCCFVANANSEQRKANREPIGPLLSIAIFAQLHKMNNLVFNFVVEFLELTNNNSGSSSASRNRNWNIFRTAANF